MALTKDDLKKIQAMFDANAKIFGSRFDRLEARVDLIEREIAEIKVTMATKEQVASLREDLEAFATTTAENKLKSASLDGRLRTVEAKLGLR